MTQYKDKRESLVTHYCTYNPETGQFYDNKNLINKPLTTQIMLFGRKWYKTQERLEEVSLSHLQRGYLWSLARYIEFETGRITISQGRGNPPITIKTVKAMGDLIGIGVKAAGVFINELIAFNILFKIKGQYYINPTFMQRGSSFPMSTAEIMMETDTEFKNWVPKDTLWKLSVFKKLT